MAVAGDLVTNLVVNSKQFGAGLAKARADLKSFVGSATSSLLSLTGITAGALGTAAGIQHARTQREEQLKLAAALKATGNAAGVSAEEIQRFADSRQRLTNFSSEVTTASAAMLTGFKNIQGQAFTRTIALAQDLSALTGAALPESMKKLAAAVNDPIAGIGGLNDVGVKFTQQQMDQIAALQESGNLYAAQAIVLKELEKTVGGVAAATADPLTQLTNLTADVAADIAQLLMPSLRELYAGLSQGLGPLNSNKDALKELGEWIASGVRFAADYGRYIAAAGIAMGALYVATNAVRIATDAWAKSTLLAQAVSGKKGLVTAGVGLVAYTVALTGLNYAMAGTEKQAQATAAEMAGFDGGQQAMVNLRQEIENTTAALALQKTTAADVLSKYEDSAVTLHKELKQIADLVRSGALTAEQGEVISSRAIDRATGIESRIRDVQGQIAIALNQTDAISLEIDNLYRKGAPLPLLNDLRVSLRTLEEINRKKEEQRRQDAEQKRLKEEAERQRKAEQGPGLFELAADLDKQAEQLKLEFKPAEERLQERLDEIELLHKTGRIDESLRDRAIAKEQREHDDKNRVDKTHGSNTALEAGSAGALSLFAKAINGEGTVSEQKQSLQVQRQIERLLARQEERQKKQLQIAERQQLRRPIIAKLG